MNYTKFERKTKNGVEKIYFEGNHVDNTGLGGTWHSGGIFAEVYKVGSFLVLQDPLKMQPFAVFLDKDEIDKYLNSLLQKNGIENKVADYYSTIKEESDPVRFMAFSAGIFRD